MKSHHLLDTFNILWISLVIAIFLVVKPSVYDHVSFIVKLCISLFLMYKFNDFVSIGKISEFDKRVCFMAGTNLFMLTCSDYINVSLERIKTIIEKIKIRLYKLYMYA